MKSLLLLFLINISLNTDSLIIDLGIKPDSVTLQNQITIEELRVHKEMVDEKPFIVISEILPQFPGGDSVMQQFVRRNIRYPKSLIKEEKQGSVVIRFVVMKQGKISNEHFKIMESIGTEFDKEIIPVIKKMPKWKPGKSCGLPVPVYVTLIFSFYLSEEGKGDVKVSRKSF